MIMGYCAAVLTPAGFWAPRFCACTAFSTVFFVALMCRRIMPIRARNSTILPVAFNVRTASCKWPCKAYQVGRPRGQVMSMLLTDGDSRDGVGWGITLVRHVPIRNLP